MATEYVKLIRVSEKSEFAKILIKIDIFRLLYTVCRSSRDVFHRVFQLKTTVNSLGIFPTEQRHLELFVIQKGF